jgi:hypothetical protein
MTKFAKTILNLSSNLLQRGGVGEEGGPPKRFSAEAKFVDFIGRRVLRVFLFAIHSHLYYRFYPLPHLSKRFETGLQCKHCKQKPQV